MELAEYVGTELALFKDAHCWKRYWSTTLSSFVKGRCCEVGAGIGANLPFLDSVRVTSWTLVEPDAKLCAEIRSRVQGPAKPLEIVNGFLSTLQHEKVFDTIAYIDVLEHIEQDEAELKIAKSLLSIDGYICILVPAHEWLRSPFDDSVGHVRRYTKDRFLELASKTRLEIVMLKELDSVGLFASLANKLLLRQSQPTHKQIMMWDKFLVGPGRLLDPLLGYSIGRSILAVLRAPHQK